VVKEFWKEFFGRKKSTEENKYDFYLTPNPDRKLMKLLNKDTQNKIPLGSDFLRVWIRVF